MNWAFQWQLSILSPTGEPSMFANEGKSVIQGAPLVTIGAKNPGEKLVAYESAICN